MTPSNPASDRNEALADVDDFLRRLRHVDPDILVWIRSLLAERAAAERAIGAALDVERLAEWFHDKRESQGIACYHRNQHLTAWDCGQDAIEAAEYARLTPQPGEPTNE